MLNVVVLTGRLTYDPELKTTPSGVSVCRFSIAVQRNYASKGSERVTDFFDVVVWRQTAEFVCKYFKKGSLISLDGTIQTGSYEKDGIKRKTFEIVANNVYFAESKSPANENRESISSIDNLGENNNFEKSYDDDMLPF